MEHGKTNVALKEVDSNHPFYNLEGSNNIVLLTPIVIKNTLCRFKAMVLVHLLPQQVCLQTL